MSALEAPCGGLVAPGPVKMSIEDAQGVQDMIADIHCWICGFLTARPDAEIPGAHRLRDGINLLRTEIARAKGEDVTERGLPF